MLSVLSLSCSEMGWSSNKRSFSFKKARPYIINIQVAKIKDLGEDYIFLLTINILINFTFF